MKKHTITLDSVCAIVAATELAIRRHEKELVILKWKLRAFKFLKKEMEQKPNG